MKNCPYCGANFVNVDAYQIHLGIGAPTFHSCHDEGEMQAEGMTQDDDGNWQIDRSLIVRDVKDPDRKGIFGPWATLKSRVRNLDEWE
jgi:hypothetical protein